MEVGCVCIPHIGAWAILESAHGAKRSAEASSPLVVIASGKVVAASVGARGRGVEIGMTRTRVQTVCPEATVCLRNAALEVAAWQRVERRLNRATPYVETVEPGQAFVRPHDARRLAAAVQDLDARAALAPSRIVAQLATGKALDGELLQIQPQHVGTFLRRLSVHALSPDVVPGEVTERLELFGYDTVHAVRHLSRRHLTAQFGDIGAQLHAALHDDAPPVSAYVPLSSVGRSHDFEHDQREPGAVEQRVQALIRQCVEELDGRTTQRLQVQIDDRNAPESTAARTLRAPTGDSAELAGIATTLLHQLLRPDMRLTRAGVELSALATPSGEQGHLFAHRPGVRKAIRAVEQQHPGALQRATTHAAAIFDEDRFSFQPVGRI
jgi:nucleotidyltransferase/DNA polymerase involved in DNA repair